MKIEKQKISDAIQIVGGVVDRNSPSAIMLNILVQSEGGKTWFTGQNKDIMVKVGIDEDLGLDTTIPAHKIVDIVKTLPNDSTINFDDKGGHIFVKSGRSRYKLSTLPSSEYPSKSSQGHEVVTKILSDDLCRMVDDTLYAVANNDVRPYLNGTYFECANGVLNLVATDGLRLAISTVDFDGDFSFIIPKKSITEINKILQRYKTDECEIIVNQTTVEFNIGNISIVSQTIGGQFPNYQAVIPKYTDTMIFDKSELVSKISRVSILSNENLKTILMKITGNSVLIKSKNPSNEEAEDVIDAEYGELDMEYACNSMFLLDAVKAVDSEKVEFCFADQSALRVRDPGSDGSFGIVTPMRL